MALNPVERCLVNLCGYWDAFRQDTSKRLLVWQVPDNATRMLQCFFEAQKHETDYSTEDLFIVFDAPYENAIQYSSALKEALAGQYEASCENLKKEGITPDWQYTPSDFPDSVNGFLESLKSFTLKHTEIKGIVSAVLMPQDIRSEEAFCQWLSRGLNVEIPEKMRLLVTDSSEHPQLSHLLESGNPLIYADSPPIDTLSIAQDTFAEEGGIGPAPVFRNFLMGLMSLVENGSADQVKAKSADALAFAQKQNWTDQEMVVSMLVAGALLKEKRFDEAVNEYKKARQSALQTEALGHPAGQKLVLQTWFGEAGVHLAAGKNMEAAQCYDQAAIVAQDIPDLTLAIEALRMGAFCHTRTKKTQGAIERGMFVLSLSEALDPDARAMTTLPIAAVDLLRLIEAKRVEQMEKIKHRRDEEQGKAHDAAEQGAAKLEGSDNVQKLQAVQERLLSDKDRADEKAMQALESLTADGNVVFKYIYDLAQNLLGKAWPLESAIAIPPLLKEAKEATS